MNLFKSHGFKLNRLANTASTQLENELLSTVDLTLSQWAALSIIWEKEGIRSSDLQKILNVKVSTASGVLKRMEKKELIIRKTNEQDKREVNIYLTDKAEKLEEAVVGKVKAYNKKLLAGFTENEKKEFMRLLDKAYENVQEGESK